MTNHGLNKTFVFLAGVQKKASTPTSTPVAMVPEVDDPYGGSTDEASDMEAETGMRISTVLEWVFMLQYVWVV